MSSGVPPNALGAVSQGQNQASPFGCGSGNLGLYRSCLKEGNHPCLAMWGESPRPLPPFLGVGWAQVVRGQVDTETNGRTTLQGNRR